MKRIIALLIISCLSINCFAQMQAKVDERIELTSIVFRLAGMEEFTAGLLIPGDSRPLIPVILGHLS